MRIALVSDMHGNAIAFDEVVRELESESFDHIVCLGDVAQGGPQPCEVIDRLRALGWRCVNGNSDEFLNTLSFEQEPVTERGLAVREWTRKQLGEERLAFLRTFEPTVELDLDGRRLVCCHATPVSNEEVIVPETPREELARALGNADVVACGHVHLQWLGRVGRQLWVSIGSAGLAWEHKEPFDEQPFDPWAEYAVLTAENGSLRVEFRRVPFDVDAVVDATRQSGMPFAEQYTAPWLTA